MRVEGNCVVRADGDHNALNRGQFLDKLAMQLLL